MATEIRKTNDSVWCAGTHFYTMDLFYLLSKYVKHVEEAAGTDFLPTLLADGEQFTEAEAALLTTISGGCA